MSIDRRKKDWWTRNSRRSCLDRAKSLKVLIYYTVQCKFQCKSRALAFGISLFLTLCGRYVRSNNHKSGMSLAQIAVQTHSSTHTNQTSCIIRRAFCSGSRQQRTSIIIFVTDMIMWVWYHLIMSATFVSGHIVNLSFAKLNVTMLLTNWCFPIPFPPVSERVRWAWQIGKYDQRMAVRATEQFTFVRSGSDD